MMKAIELGVWLTLMLGTITTSIESLLAINEQGGPMSALRKISTDLDEITVEKTNHHQKMKDGIARRFQAILQSDMERHEILKASLQRILDADILNFGEAPMELINNISKKIEYSRENDKETIQILANETSAQVETINKQRREHENELKAMFRQIFKAFSISLEDCSALIELGLNASGIYHLNPEGMGTSFPAYCDMDSDGGGWTVIQRRGNFNHEDVSFNRSWSEYKTGFGNLNGEFWLGNDKIHALTKERNLTLRVLATDIRNNTFNRTYETFQISYEEDSYKPSFMVSLSDPFGGLYQEPFSTYDRISRRCYNGAGWWYWEDCRKAAHLNGPKKVSGKYGFTLNGDTPLLFSTMKIKPINK